MLQCLKKLICLAFALLLFCPSQAFAQIDLFGNVRDTLDNQYRHMPRPYDTTRVFDIGWDPKPALVVFRYGNFPTPSPVLIPVPDTSKSFSNNTPNAASFPYHATCEQTVTHTWRMTYGMTGDLVGVFNALPGIDAASPGSGQLNLRQGQTVTNRKRYSQSIEALVQVPAMSSVTVQAYYEQFPVVVPFDVAVKIGGSFRFEAIRGHPPGRVTRVFFTQGLGSFYRQHPHPHIEVLNDLYVIVKLLGEYRGAIGRSPGNFNCQAKANL